MLFRSFLVYSCPYDNNMAAVNPIVVTHLPLDWYMDMILLHSPLRIAVYLDRLGIGKS